MSAVSSSPEGVGLEAALDLERDGHLVEAAHAYQSILAGAPDHPEVLFRLGVTMGRLGQRDLAARLVGQAVAREPGAARYHEAMGDALLGTGYAEDAAECYREAIRLDPAAAGARYGLAESLLDLGRTAEVAPLLVGAQAAARGRRALARLALAERRLDPAIAGFVDYLRETPEDPAAFFYLGVALQGKEMLEPAAASYAEALRGDPGLFEAHTNLSTVLTTLGRSEEALPHADRALEIAPARPGLYLNRANVRRDLGDLTGAVADYRAALERDPAFAEGWSSLANAYHDLGEWSLALEAHAAAVRVAPELAQAHWNRSFTLLATGSPGPGWDEYEWRHQTAAARPEPRDFPWPVWHGEPLAGKSIVVWREQGLGDEILFATCIRDLVDAGARVTLLATDRLAPLFARALPEVTVRVDGQGAGDPAEPFDYQSPLASLPRWVRRERAAFPPRCRLLTPEPGLAAAWEERLAGLGPKPHVGICWRSGLVTPDRQRHYAPLDRWAPLLVVPGITWVNLQYDDCEDELAAAEARWGVRIHRWPDLDLRGDLEAVTALISGLDAVVTAPTAVGSFAGALGVTSWEVDSGSDWTALGEDRSPWFPSLRIVRRPPGTSDWEPVLRQVASEVDSWCRGRIARSH